MGDLFNSILKSDESIFLNPQFLDYDYQPKLIPFRESQQQYIATCIKPLLQRRNGRNLIIYGKPGIGKTVCIKNVLNELENDFSNEMYCIYINAWKKDSSFKIITEICHQVNYKFTHNKNFDELIKEASKIINEKSIVIIIDEADKLQDHDIIYSLLDDFHRKCLILITNESNFIIKIDARIKSRLSSDTLEFKPYNQQQTESILKQRAEYAFVKNTLSEEAFNLISKKTFELGDIRAGLFLLKQSGENAENKSSKLILLQYAEEAIKSFNINELENEDTSLLELIKEHSGKAKPEIFKIYEEKEGKSYRTFQRKINDLEKNNKILSKEGLGDLGKTTFLEFKED